MSQEQQDIIFLNEQEMCTPEMSRQASEMEKVKYKIVQNSEIYKILQNNLQEINSIIQKGLDWALIFFNYFQWNMEKCLTTFFQKMEKIQKQTHYTNKPYQFIQKKQICKVCNNIANNFLINICGHNFCVDCWKDYVSFNINNNVAFSRCMEDGCKFPILDSMIKKVLSPSLQKKYQKLLISKVTERSKNIKFCMGVDCNYCIQSNDVLLKFVQCNCGYSFCFKCKNEVHKPCDCRQVLKWKDIIEKQQANAKWILANTKVCPFCHKNVQRSTGCNFMLCAPPGGCGKSFCYVCSKPWEPDHVDHFKCNVYKPGNQQDQKEKARQVLKKINFYGEKYISNDQVKKKLKLIFSQCTQIQNKLFNQFQLSLTQTQFIIDAYKTLIQSCDMLKWSYAYRFFMNENNQKNKDIFQFKQGEFQRYKQNLTFKLQTKLKKMLESMLNENKQIQEKKSKKQQLIQFNKIKQQVVTYHFHTYNFMNQLTDMVQKGQIEL